jgi:hypothetical protein
MQVSGVQHVPLARQTSDGSAQAPALPHTIDPPQLSGTTPQLLPPAWHVVRVQHV